ncbi:MAG: hypothetical protein OXC40_02280 [Proteobacteria bacterium]|nr:hypothetical protein [Pseudomonadota bacterium]
MTQFLCKIMQKIIKTTDNRATSTVRYMTVLWLKTSAYFLVYLLIGCGVILSCKNNHNQDLRKLVGQCDPENNSVDDCLFDQELAQGQSKLFEGVRACTDEKGNIVSVDGKQTIASSDSEKTIFLRCLFLGGNLNNCVQHNNCQVIMNYETCESELSILKETYPEISHEWKCQKTNSAS